MCCGNVSAKDLVLVLALVDILFCAFAIYSFFPSHVIGVFVAVIYLLGLLSMIAGHFFDNANLYSPFLVINGVVLCLNLVAIIFLCCLLFLSASGEKVAIFMGYTEDIAGYAYRNALELMSLRIDVNTVQYAILSTIAMSVIVECAMIYFEYAAWTAADSIWTQELIDLKKGKMSQRVAANIDLEKTMGTSIPAKTCRSTTSAPPHTASLVNADRAKKPGHSSIKIQRRTKE